MARWAGYIGIAGLAACLLPQAGPSDLNTPPQGIDLVELSWLDPEHPDPAKALTSEPVACVPDSLSPAARAGELAFNSPALLGGQAAKKRLSCGSCHQNGRGNPSFHIASLSGAPGTADVTSGLFGPERADETFNPVPIPDLAMADGQDQVDRSDTGALTQFVSAQIVEEFSGAPASEAVLGSLVTYLQSIDLRHCSGAAGETIPLGWLNDWRDAKDAADLALSANDSKTRAFYTQTSRAALGRLNARFSAADIRSELVALSQLIATGEPWPGDMTTALEARLAALAPASLYSRSVIRKALETADPN